MREIAVLAEAEVARACEIAVFAEPPGGPAEADRASVREIVVFAEAEVASVREIAVFADVQVAPRPEDSEVPEVSEAPTRTGYIYIYIYVLFLCDRETTEQYP